MPEENKKTSPAKVTTTDDDSLRTVIAKRYRACVAHYSDWIEEAKKDTKFALGDQWTDEEREELRAQKRPCLTFNHIAPIINIVAGYQRENSARIKVFPEGAEDQQFSNMLDKNLQYINRTSKLEYKLSYCFDDGVRCGKGWIEALVNYDRDPRLGELKFVHSKYYSIMPDPNSVEYDINEDAEYVFKVGRYTKAKLIRMFPDQKDVIEGYRIDSDDPTENGEAFVLKEGDADNYGNDPNVDTINTKSNNLNSDDVADGDSLFTLKEYWYKKYEKTFLVYDKEADRLREYASKEAATQAATLSKSEVIEKGMPKMWVASMCGGFILQDILSPLEPNYHGFPFFRFMADWTPSAEDEVNRVMGVVRPMKDPQKEKNKSKSQFLHIISTSANSGWVGDSDALTKPQWGQLEKLGSAPGITVQKKAGSYLERIAPSAVPMAQIMREKAADDEFRQCSGINADLLSLNDKEMSGRAMAFRIRQGVLSLSRIFTNFKYTKEMIGNFILHMFPEIFDTKKMMRILGPKFMEDNQLTEGSLAGYLTIITDYRYDIEVTEADNSATSRMETLDNLRELAQAGYPVPLEVLFKYMNMPNTEEVKKQIQEEQQRQLEMAQAGGQGNKQAPR